MAKLKREGDILLLGLAVWRLAYLFTQEEGPFHFFADLRYKLGIRTSPAGENIVQADPHTIRGTLAGIFSCIYCMSIWLSFFFSVLLLIRPLAVVLAVPFAISTIALGINRLYENG